MFCSGVEKAEHYEAYQTALEGAMKLTLRYFRFLFFGPPRSCKSTMRQRMLQEIVNLSSLGLPSVSTGIAEGYEIIIKKMTSEAAAISGSQWHCLKKSNEEDITARENTYNEIGLNHLAQLFYCLIHSHKADPLSTPLDETIHQPPDVAFSARSNDPALTSNVSLTDATFRSKKDTQCHEVYERAAAESVLEISGNYV